MKFRSASFRSLALAAAIAAPLALAACNDSDDASYEAGEDTVEFEADAALSDIESEPVADPQANAPEPVDTRAQADREAAAAAAAAEREQSIQDEGDDAAATAAAADAMIEE